MNEERDQKSPAGRSVASCDSGGTQPAATPKEASKEKLAEEARPLSEAEQMALYEEKLKEDDWGHQPC